MTRTNIDLDDQLVAAVMRRYHLKTKKEAVELALRRLAGPPLSGEYLRSLEGMGWGNDEFDEAHASRIEELYHAAQR